MNNFYALVDCNNFYASCERVFDPTLNGKPVIVLSNNDGCAIARSNEAKALGIKMGHPIFKCRDIVEKNDIKVFSSNFVLYGDMSERVMKILSEFTPDIEIYSIDEAFLFFNEFNSFSIEELGEKILNDIKIKVGLPVSVGIGPTKTLAKVANHIAKKDFSKKGVFCMLTDSIINESLNKIPVEEIWGIGHRKAEWLNRQGIKTAYELKEQPDSWIKKHLTIMTLRTAHELRGVSCIPLEKVPPHKKAIVTSRSFGYEVTKYQELFEAVSAYTAKCAEKLRKQKSSAGYISVYIQSNPFKHDEYYSNSAGIYISPPTAFSSKLISFAENLLSKIFRDGYHYKKVGVMLSNFSPDNACQQDLFDNIYDNSKAKHLMEIIDKINSNINSGKVLFASEGLGKPWYMKQAHKSKRFTTRWDELLEINI